LFLWTWGAFRILAYPSDYWTLHPGAASQLFCLDSIPLERPAFVDWTWYPQASLSLGTWHTKRPGYCCCLQLPDPKWSRVQDLAVQNSTTDSGRRIGLTSSTCCRGLPRSTRARHATELSSRARFFSSATSYGRILCGRLVSCCHVNVIRRTCFVFCFCVAGAYSTVMLR